MNLRQFTIVRLFDYPMRVEGLIKDDLFYLDTQYTANLISRYLFHRYGKDYGKFYSDWEMESGEIIVYCPDVPEEVFKSIRSVCKLLISHDLNGNRINPIFGLLKAENGKDVIRIHARSIIVYNRPKAGSVAHYKYLEKLKNK